jgi:tetratricopeptide (TPR) repeat protein
MGKTPIALAATLLVGLAATPGLRAGVYNTAEPAIWPLPSSFPEFQYRLGEMRSVAVDRPKNPGETETPYERGLRLVAALETKARTDGLTVDDRINLGASYIRLLKYEEAVRALTPAETQDPGNFMVLANLATANQGAGRLDRAIAYLQQALAAWPDIQIGFDPVQLRWYRRAERFHLLLLQLREQENRLQVGRPVETVDAIFGRLRFNAPGGEYEPGRIPSDQWDQLPGDWLPLLSQLVFWLPFDDRLYWLMAELVNGQGGPDIALQMMDELVYSRRFAGRECTEHRRTLKKYEEAITQLTGEKGRVGKERLLGVVLPRGAGLAPGGGAMMQEVGWLVALDYQQKIALGGPPIDPGNSPTNGGAGAASNSPAPPAFWQPDVRHLVVSFLAGVAVTVLLMLQVRANRARGKTAVG